MNSVAVIEQKGGQLVQEAGAIVIRDVAEVEIGKTMIQGIKLLKKEIEETFDPIISKAHQAHKEAVAQKKKYIEPLDAAEGVIKNKISACLIEIEKRARIEAEKRAEEERKAMEREIERHIKRLDTLAAKATSLQQELEIVELELERHDLTEVEEGVLQRRRNTLLAKIQNANSAAVEKQVAIEETAQMVAATIPITEKIKVDGMTTSTTKEPQVVNALALVKAVAAGNIPIEVIAFDLKVIRKLVNAGMTLPGVAVTLKRNIRVTG